MLGFLYDFGGLLIGLVFLLFAVSILPNKIKWYVLTAGLAIIGYEFYVRSRNKKLLKEADAEREKLRERVKKLDERKVELETKVTALNKESVELKQKHADLQNEKASLRIKGEELSERSQKIDVEITELLENNEKKTMDIDEAENILTILQGAENSFKRVDIQESK